ncbi:hypothetical protein HPY86_08255 [candidate division WOR-3 bacterium]|nr:hypothetical protein [candidate division WOR-3 bacterium]
MPLNGLLGLVCRLTHSVRLKVLPTTHTCDRSPFPFLTTHSAPNNLSSPLTALPHTFSPPLKGRQKGEGVLTTLAAQPRNAPTKRRLIELFNYWYYRLCRQPSG